MAKRPKTTLLLDGKRLRVLDEQEAPPSCYGTWEPICANDDFCGPYFLPCKEGVLKGKKNA